jgi:hypothetical protein
MAPDLLPGMAAWVPRACMADAVRRAVGGGSVRGAPQAPP